MRQSAGSSSSAAPGVPGDVADDPAAGNGRSAVRHQRDDIGGDPACWLNRVCESCGRFIDDEFALVCPNCGAPR